MARITAAGPPAKRPPQAALAACVAPDPLSSTLPSPMLSRRRLGAALGGTLLAATDPRHARAAELPLDAPPRALPEFGFTDAEGLARGIADFAGQGVVINLWATWCAPCVAEMPALDRAQARLDADGIVVLALSSDRGGRAAVEGFYRQRGIQRLGVWLDPRGAAARALGARGLPTTVIVDRAGRERARLEGAAEWDQPAALAAIRRLVGPAPPRANGPGKA